MTDSGLYRHDKSQDKGRLLSAGYHSVVGYYRDDAPLMQLILDEKAQKELDRYWLEFDYMADATNRTWDQYYFNQSGAVQGHGAESGRERPANKPVNDSSVIAGIRDEHLALIAKNPNNDPEAP